MSFWKNTNSPCSISLLRRALRRAGAARPPVGRCAVVHFVLSPDLVCGMLVDDQGDRDAPPYAPSNGMAGTPLPPLGNAKETSRVVCMTCRSIESPAASEGDDTMRMRTGLVLATLGRTT
ncbi:hypothetical protein Ssi02_16780 [Sinosporangium siamense]|uniref:Uncharacterized protein n=1 Tax=Sinosporangium siamense TaxID=1367973 RepID=A0A919RD12_9ACTN|nr:hypothetical protein Ssi02_16780 [Sinosporangium siamense]